jgi:hypothetical protein
VSLLTIPSANRALSGLAQNLRLRYIAWGLAIEERLAMMRIKSKEMLKQSAELAYRKPFEIVKRS